MDIYVWNQSSVVTDDDGLKATAAIQVQMARDFGPAWGVSVVLHYVAKAATPPPGVHVVKLVDTSDVDGALGYHDQDGAGIVGVQTCLDDGVSWTSCLSHEVGELAADPEAVRCFQIGAEVVALEPFDAPEGVTYKIDDVEVQGFVLPAYFIKGAKGPYSFPTDHPNALQSGYPALSSGGYNSKAPIGEWSQDTAAMTRRAKRTAGGRRARRIKASGQDPTKLALVPA